MQRTMEQDHKKFNTDIKALDNLANAYNNCESEDMKKTWQDKWYQMCMIISDRIKQCD